MTLKLLIIGHARHGKDTVAELLRKKYGLIATVSSRRALEIFLYDELKPKYGYFTFEEAYRDRVNHRAKWFDRITAYNLHDKTRLARGIMADSDVYVGMRSRDEIKACVKAKIFDAVIWVDASDRLPPEPCSSFDIDWTLADIVIDNNGPESELETSVETMWDILTTI